VVCEGFDIQSMGLAAPRLGPALHLAPAQLGPVFSASIVGLLIGAVLFGALADRVGRKPVLIASVAVFGLFSLATAFARAYPDLLAIRALAGLGLGGALPNLLALAAEAAAPDHRARLVTRLACGMPTGGVICGLAAAAAPGWREIFYVGGLAPLALAPLIAVAMPESAAFRARNAGAASPNASTSPPDLKDPTHFLRVLFGDGRAVSTLLLWIASFASLLALYVLLNWLPTLMGQKGVPKAQASLVSMLFNIGAVIGTLILAGLVEGGRRQRNIAVWYGGLGLSLIALARVGPVFAAAGAAGFAAGFFISSVPLPLYGLAPTYYEVAVRGTGVGASVAVGRLGAIVGPLIAAALLAAGAGASGVLLALIPIAALAGGATIALAGRPGRAA
jgi:AAHS family 3-hydroxyphenylpropionic acid transporter